MEEDGYVVFSVDWNVDLLRLQDANEEAMPTTRKSAMIFFIFADSFLHLFSIMIGNIKRFSNNRVRFYI